MSTKSTSTKSTKTSGISSEVFSIQFYVRAREWKTGKIMFASNVMQNPELVQNIQQVNVYWSDPALDAEGIALAQEIGGNLFTNPVLSRHSDDPRNYNHLRNEDGVYVPISDDRQRNAQVFRGAPRQSTAQIREFFSPESLTQLGVSPS